jgi:hypothetical protein
MYERPADRYGFHDLVLRGGAKPFPTVARQVREHVEANR